MLKIQELTPFILCPDLSESIAFYENLGFECTFRGEKPGYAFIRCEGGALRLLETDDPDARAAMKQHMVYIDVPSADAFWQEYGPFLRTLPEGRARAPFDQPYMQREVHVLDPGGTLLFFGHEITER